MVLIVYPLVQTPELVVVIDENGNPPREIYLDGRDHPVDLNPTYMGHSNRPMGGGQAGRRLRL